MCVCIDNGDRKSHNRIIPIFHAIFHHRIIELQQIHCIACLCATGHMWPAMHIMNSYIENKISSFKKNYKPNIKCNESITCYSISRQIYVRTSFALGNCVSLIKFFFIYCCSFSNGKLLLPRCSVSPADSQRNTTCTTWFAISSNENECTLIVFLQPNIAKFSFWWCNLCISCGSIHFQRRYYTIVAGNLIIYEKIIYL